uniref:UDP-3-O-[3-hydroxymyristoyl] glucosamine N-acyltransferase non-repeat region domain-containing protein n=1 Tax=Leersia perrieri TaxID=77586 RepID=A0A0D9WVA0_9ORYZ
MAASLFFRRSVPQHNAGMLARFLCNASSDASIGSPEFVPWRNGGGILHRAASVDPTAVVEAGAVVHSGAVLGKGVVVGSGAVVGPSVSIGQSTRIWYNVVLSNCSVGDFCTIHNGACIGQDGFGFFVGEDGQMLHAKIGNHVEIGANTCIDRGSWRDTVIGDETKIDNLVQIGHNVVIGKCCMICGQVGIAGSATLGDYVTLGGRVAIRDHVSIASKVRLAANSSVTKDIPKSGDYGGFPAVPINEWRRQTANLRIFSKKDGWGGRVAIRDHVSIASKVRLAANSSVTKDIQKHGDYGGFPARYEVHAKLRDA